jgi:hypothetical protein
MTNVINYLIFIVSTTMTYILGIQSKIHKWNDTLPIPMQNCLVGIIVFILAYVFCLITKTEANIDDIIQQILLSFGGVGTATLGYDMQKVGKE